jgi:predicted NUDIX family NTP pyrophosphohydrolase
MYRRPGRALEVLLVHPGGPFWTHKDAGAWTIPKGECGDAEDPFETAKREFVEETGFAPGEAFIELAPVRQAGGKRVYAWAFEGDCDPARMVSNTCEMEWPPRSGKRATFPEVDRAQWFDLPTAKTKINAGQVRLLEELALHFSRA